MGKDVTLIDRLLRAKKNLETAQARINPRTKAGRALGQVRLDLWLALHELGHRPAANTPR